MAWTSASEVIGAWVGSDAPTDSAKVDVWVGKAERLLRSRVPTLAARLAVLPVVELDLLGNVKDVVTDMVCEVFRNPEGVRQRQEGSGPFTGSVTYGGDKPGALVVTADQIKLLSPVGRNRGAFTVETIPLSSPFSSLPVVPESLYPSDAVYPS